ncbi:MAG: hypothetical protein C0448_02590 [Sphingobacteriaceae bacterium]|nr:hypothetical protein [Sphingobacteriaceae bacterium]
MKLLTSIILLFVFENINAQTNCTVDNLKGKWSHLTSLDQKTNWTREKINNCSIDSTKAPSWTLSFDSSFVYNRKGRPKTAYVLSQEYCKITYTNRLKSARLRTDEIIYLDEKYLILRIPNPHSSTDHLFIKN